MQTQLGRRLTSRPSATHSPAATLRTLGPPAHPTPVQVVVGTSFEDEVFKSGKDVFIGEGREGAEGRARVPASEVAAALGASLR